MSVLNITDLHASLQENINRPAELMRENFSGVNELLSFVTPYLITSGRMPLPRLKTGRIVTHNNGANKDNFVPKEDVMALTNRWLQPEYNKINFALKESEILALWNSYLFRVNANAGTQTQVMDYMTRFPFQDIIFDEIAKRAYKDMLDDAWTGVMGVNDSPVDGLLTKIIDATTPATEGAATEIPQSHIASTAAFTESNVVTELKKIFAKVAATPGALRLPLQIHVAPEVLWLYNNYKETLTKNYTPIVRNGFVVPVELSNAIFVPQDGLQGKNAVVITEPRNIAFGLNTLPGQINMRTALVDYEVRVYGNMNSDINFNDGRFVWTNDNLA